MSFFRMSQDLNMALRFCFKQQLPPPSYHICRFSTVQKRWIDFSFLQFLQVMNFLLVGVTVGRDRCRHPCHGRGCCNGRGTCRCLCYGRNNAEVGIPPFGECSFGETTWCQKILTFHFSFFWTNFRPTPVEYLFWRFSSPSSFLITDWYWHHRTANYIMGLIDERLRKSDRVLLVSAVRRGILSVLLPCAHNYFLPPPPLSHSHSFFITLSIHCPSLLIYISLLVI